MDAKTAEALAAAVGHSLPSGLVVALEANERLRAENAELREDNERLRQDHDRLADQLQGRTAALADASRVLQDTRDDLDAEEHENDRLRQEVRMWRRKCLKARLWHGAGPYDR